MDLVHLLIPVLVGDLRRVGTGNHRFEARRLPGFHRPRIHWCGYRDVVRAELGLPDIFSEVGTASFPIVWFIIGSALFVAIVSLLTRSRP
jgi:hypothetical protein